MYDHLPGIVRRTFGGFLDDSTRLPESLADLIQWSTIGVFQCTIVMGAWDDLSDFIPKDSRDVGCLLRKGILSLILLDEQSIPKQRRLEIVLVSPLFH